MNLLQEIRDCRLCEFELPHGPRPLVQFDPASRILIVGQAPGLAAHQSQIPWNDKSGERLRCWLGFEARLFYDPKVTAIVPLGFCYPGKSPSGDLPPRRECRVRWLDSVLCELQQVRLTVLVGQHAIRHFLGPVPLDELLRRPEDKLNKMIALPHPSPRNNIWLSKNPWFERDCLRSVRSLVAAAVSDP